MERGDTEALLKEMIDHQRSKLLKIASRYIPNISHEDLLQPFDYPVLENNPTFRYEEGVLQGLKMVEMALLAKKIELECS